ncbi:MAG TPA: Asp-tRNA(Asn)/Glu-tRNA(Gln) amidotransferase subunit GatA [Patescibacteria group bacterium]|nr:Asp-tRNA(Asn)/Glu-tRNA(Gln) amidotransferase subunit GatA [Patescibacteria group bacterium]
MSWEPIAGLAEKVQAGQLTAQELVEKSLKLIDEKSVFHAILSVTAERARKRAKEIDEKVKRGQKVGRLAGIPFIAKDNFLTFGGKTTAASHILEPFDAPYQSTAIEKLEAEGAIVVAKANLDAFAHGSSTENSAFGPTLNPHDKTRVPGGSSGGSGASVALELAPFALGTDTGGSIRLPASYCGVVGYKPTYGLVSRYGVVAMASSTDVIGPLAKTVEDAALVLEVMSGRDKFDGTTIERDKADYSDFTKDVKGKKIGIVKEYFSKGLDKNVRAIVETSIKKLQKAGAEIKEVSLPSIDLALACYYIIVPAEVSSNLSRYDGQRYGLAIKDAKDLDESYEKARELGFEAENKRRIMIGTYVLSSGYYDAYYKRAQTVRTKLINEFNGVFKDVDFLVGPTAPTTAFKLGENVGDPLKMYLADIMTVAANLTGIPAISVPAGEVNGMPVGLQLMAPQRADRPLMAIAKCFQEVSK